MKKPKKPAQTKIAIGQKAAQFEPVAVFIPVANFAAMAVPAPQYAPVALQVAVASWFLLTFFYHSQTPFYNE